MTDADKMMHPLHFGTGQIRHIRIRINPKSRTESWITLGLNFVVGEGLHSLSALVLFYFIFILLHMRRHTL